MTATRSPFSCRYCEAPLVGAAAGHRGYCSQQCDKKDKLREHYDKMQAQALKDDREFQAAYDKAKEELNGMLEDLSGT